VIARCALALFALSLSLFAQGGKQDHFHEVARWQLGGEGGWDYLTFDADQNRLFIARGNRIMVADASSGKQTGEIPAEGAHGVALVPDQNKGFSSNGRAGTVTVFDLKTLKPITTVQVGENPDAIIYDPNSKRVLVMNGRSKDLMAIDPTNNRVSATVPLGGKLEFAAATKGHVYVNVEDTGEIASVDTASWKNDHRWKLQGCEEPSGLAYDAKDNRLFTVCGNKKMLVLDAKNGKQLASVDTGSGTDAAAYDAGLDLAFASNGEGTLTVVNAGEKNYSVLQNVQTKRGARTMTLDPKSHRLFTVTADFGPPAEGQSRPSVKAGTFEVLVYAPEGR
jgi:YVTN family beta-propeller protein